MDFGEILKLWESSGRPAADKPRQPAGRKESPAKAPDNGTSVASLQSAWLDRHGILERDGRGIDDSPEPRLSKRDIDAMSIDASLDLHGMTTKEAGAALSEFFMTAERTGCRKVLLVHGKGLHSATEPVLEGFVRRWLESRASAGRSGHADAANGGKGATWVLLKQSRPQKQPGTQRSR